jgi:DNA methylase/ParB-like nuclease domain
MKIEKVKLSEIKPNPKNPRLIKDEKFKKLVKSIKDFPQMLELRPIVVDENNIILGGNMRFKALKEAGHTEVSIVRANDLTNEQKDEFIVKDNVGFGEWDWDSLANEWEVDKLEEWGLDLPVDLSVQEELEAEEDNYEIPNEINTDIVLGDLFEIGEHRLLCGDSTDSDQVAKLMNGQMPDFIHTDPPYGINYSSENSGYKTNNKFEVIKNDEEGVDIVNLFLFDCPKVVWGANCFPDKLPHRGRWAVWYKRGEGAEKALGSPFELAWIDIHSGYDRFYKIVHGGFVNSDGGKRLHPTQKPVKLVDEIIKDLANDSNLILDLFLGSGTTMLASHQLKRKCYGMELDPKYCQIIIDRMKKLDPSLIIKRNGVQLK